MLVYVENVVCIVSGGIEFNLSKDIKKLLRKHLKIAEHIKIFFIIHRKEYLERKEEEAVQLLIKIFSGADQHVVSHIHY